MQQINRIKTMQSGEGVLEVGGVHNGFNTVGSKSWAGYLLISPQKQWTSLHFGGNLCLVA